MSRNPEPAQQKFSHGDAATARQNVAQTARGLAKAAKKATKVSFPGGFARVGGACGGVFEARRSLLSLLSHAPEWNYQPVPNRNAILQGRVEFPLLDGGQRRRQQHELTHALRLRQAAH